MKCAETDRPEYSGLQHSKGNQNSCSVVPKKGEALVPDLLQRGRGTGRIKNPRREALLQKRFLLFSSKSEKKRLFQIKEKRKADLMAFHKIVEKNPVDRSGSK